jgi:ubiquitin carboxyl-terminal hydrolase 5/13
MDSITPLATQARTATPHDTVINSECVYSFHTPHHDGGILVGLDSFVGMTESAARRSSNDESSLFVRIRKHRVQKEKGEVSKLAMGISGGFEDTHETISTYSVVVLNASGIIAELPYNDDTKHTFPMNITNSVDSIINHEGLSVKQDLSAWELNDEKPISKYAANLPFVDNGVTIPPPSEWRCQKTDETSDHLWLNLSDGFIGGGRKNWDGSGGTNGALDHFIETGEKYPLVVKLGTITEDVESADCYSYARDEDGPVKIPNLKELLEKRGVCVAGMQKTVKSTAELEVELNATYAFDAIVEKGSHLVPVAGPGLQGLQNLGNSCYMNSVVQMLFSGVVPELASRYGVKNGDVLGNTLLNIDPKKASDDLLCQAAKLSSALTSGVFCGPVPDSAVVTDDPASADPKYRLAPRMFKHCVGHDHVDFRTGQQQDAAQYLQYLLEKLDRAELGAGDRLKSRDGGSPLIASHLFSYQTETRLVCKADDMVMYKTSPAETMLSLRIPMSKATLPDNEMPDVKRQKSEDAGEDEKDKKEVPTVTFDACIDEWAATSTVDDYRWNHLNSVSKASSKLSLVNFPRYLLIQMQRYEIGDDWQPKKIEVKIDIPEEISLDRFKATGPQDGENLVPADVEMYDAPALAAPAIDEAALSQLMDMGFNMNGCKRALMAVGGSNVEAAMNWVFEHNMDPDFNDPLPEGAAAAPSSSSDVDEGVVRSLVENLGCFNVDQVRAAVKHCDGAADRAADWLFSHMDNLDGAIAALENSSAPSGGTSAPTVPLEDGEGKYTLVGLVSHIGKNTGSGHYVAHLKKDGKWVIFNDEKVALSQDPPIEHAYLYLFVRNDAVGSPHPEY